MLHLGAPVAIIPPHGNEHEAPGPVVPRARGHRMGRRLPPAHRARRAPAGREGVRAHGRRARGDREGGQREALARRRGPRRALPLGAGPHLRAGLVVRGARWGHLDERARDDGPHRRPAPARRRPAHARRGRCQRHRVLAGGRQARPLRLREARRRGSASGCRRWRTPPVPSSKAGRSTVRASLPPASPLPQALRPRRASHPRRASSSPRRPACR